MSLSNCKIEQDWCRCCHSEGSFKNLAASFKTATAEEIYENMLKECYDIDMAPIQGMLSAITYTICEVCIMRLRDALDFKKQVLLCEERFKEIYKRNGLKAAANFIDIEIKEEIPVPESDDVFKDETTLEDKGETPLDDKDDDFEVFMIHEEEEEEEIPIEVEVKKKRKYKKKVLKTNPVKSKKNKNLKKEALDENDAEKKQDEIVPLEGKALKEQPPPIKVKEGDDLNKKRQITVKEDDDFKRIDDKYHCMRCDKIYCNKKSLTTHVKKVHYKIKEFKCSLCVDAFRTESLLTVHKLEVHKVDERVTCNVCNKLFNAKCYLMIHIRNYHLQGEVGQRFKCEFCDFVTLLKKNLNKHKFTHKMVKDFKCRYCKKSFKRPTTLNFHERIHTGDRRKVCSECGQAFVQKASLNYHMVKYHPNVKF